MVKGLSRLAIKYGLISAVYSFIRLYFFLIRVRSIDEERIAQYLNPFRIPPPGLLGRPPIGHAESDIFHSSSMKQDTA
jgi:hypothetical protein